MLRGKSQRGHVQKTKNSLVKVMIYIRNTI